MAKTDKEKEAIFDRIRNAFNELTESEQVEIMAEMYWDLSDYYEDEFLHETDND